MHKHAHIQQTNTIYTLADILKSVLRQIMFMMLLIVQLLECWTFDMLSFNLLCFLLQVVVDIDFMISQPT